MHAHKPIICFPKHSYTLRMPPLCPKKIKFFLKSTQPQVLCNSNGKQTATSSTPEGRYTGLKLPRTHTHTARCTQTSYLLVMVLFFSFRASSRCCSSTTNLERSSGVLRDKEGTLSSCSPRKWTNHQKPHHPLAIQGSA